MEQAKPMKKLKARRKILGYTQGDLARMVGVKKAAICKYEKGERVPNMEMISKLAKALGCRVSDINEYADAPINTACKPPKA